MSKIITIYLGKTQIKIFFSYDLPLTKLNIPYHFPPPSLLYSKLSFLISMGSNRVALSLLLTFPYERTGLWKSELSWLHMYLDLISYLQTFGLANICIAYHDRSWRPNSMKTSDSDIYKSHDILNLSFLICNTTSSKDGLWYLPHADLVADMFLLTCSLKWLFLQIPETGVLT